MEGGGTTAHYGAGKTSSIGGDLTQFRLAPVPRGGQNVPRAVEEATVLI
jgi:hypothetical protein